MNEKYSENSIWIPLQPSNDQRANYLFGETVYEAGSDLLRSEFGAIQEKILGSGSAYVQRNIIGKYFSNPEYYFQVNEQYVKNKLKLILLPFLHKGHWMRTTKMVDGSFAYEIPIYDIHAPDLYIPLMAFGTYVVLSGFLLGINGKFSPEVLSVQFTNGLLCWLFQVLLLEATLQSLGGGNMAVLDIVAYGGYAFVAASIAVLARVVWRASFYGVALWECLCMGVFFVKTMKRILIAEVTSSQKHSSKCHYLLLLVALAQAPLLFWLGSFGDYLLLLLLLLFGFIWYFANFYRVLKI